MPPPSRRRCQAFTLIELLVALVIAGVLAAVALPSFVQQIRKARRSDAAEAAAAVQHAQERWRGNHTSYTTSLASLGLNSTSRERYYGVELKDSSATGYTLVLTAAAGSSQAKDTGCSTLTVTVSAGAATYAQPMCWSR